MLSHQAKIDIIADIIYEHLKGKHKDALSIKLAKEIVNQLAALEDNNL
jgi:acetyl-CoA carboxylase alpha subunit